jgi:UDP-glucose 4-epimerase
LKIIVTGGTGFIGRHLVKKLSTYTPCSVVIISNAPNASGKNAEHIEWQEQKPIRFYSVDIRNKEKISNIFQDEKVDTCIHLAAKISVADSLRNPEETIDVNVNGTLNVLDACHKSGVKNFILASSAAVYGDVTKLPISENQMLIPLSPYGSSKKLAEQHVSSYARSGKIQNAMSLRFFNVYGSGQTNETDVVTKFVKRLSNGMPPIIYGDGTHTRDFISIDDVVDALIISIRTMEQSGNNHNSRFSSPAVFNVGTGIPTSINDLARKIIDEFGCDFDPIYDKEGIDSKVILHSYADMTKSREILHFVPKKPIDIGLKEMIDPIILKRNFHYNG